MTSSAASCLLSRFFFSVARPGRLTIDWFCRLISSVIYTSIANCTGWATEELWQPTRPAEDVTKVTKCLKIKGNFKFDSNWNLPIGAWNMIFKNIILSNLEMFLSPLLLGISGGWTRIIIIYMEFCMHITLHCTLHVHNAWSAPHFTSLHKVGGNWCHCRNGIHVHHGLRCMPWKYLG